MSCHLSGNLSTEERCDLVKNLSDVCEGSGYLAYTALVNCEEPPIRWLVFAGFVLWLLFLFLAVAVIADSFFSPNIAGVVSYLKISENIAGVTFMAFGNGAPDFFASLASVLGSDKPKVGLAIGGLVGGGIFVTTAVVGSIMLVKPFKVMRRPIIRDLGFYLCAVAFTIYVFLNDQLQLWETIGFIVIYVTFALVVIGGRVIRQRTLKVKRRARVAAAMAQSLPISTIIGQLNGHPDRINPSTLGEPIDEEPEWNFEPISATKLDRRKQVTTVFKDLLIAIFPIAEDEWKGNLFQRIFAFIKVPIILVLKFTNPHAENHWSKALAIIHCFACPLFAVAAVRQAGWTPFGGGPPLWALSLIVGIIPTILILIFTSFDQEPRIFKPLSAFIGLITAVFWIYRLANEVVGVLQMIGVISGLPDEVLGLTLLAWSNSLGDLVADVAVARRGFSRMGISAAFGGPLFNLLLGIGLPFTIAVLKNNGPLPVDFSSTAMVLLSFLGVSLASTLILLLVQRFYVHRWHGAYLLALYVACLVVALLTALGVIFKGRPEDNV